MDPPVLTGTEVVWNPFEDIVPRRDATAEKAKAEAARCGPLRCAALCAQQLVLLCW